MNKINYVDNLMRLERELEEAKAAMDNYSGTMEYVIQELRTDYHEAKLAYEKFLVCLYY